MTVVEVLVTDKEKGGRTTTFSLKSEFNCPYCGSNNLIEEHESGEVTCVSCASVIRERGTNPGPNWTSHAGPPPSFSRIEKGLPTVIGSSFKDANGRTLLVERAFDFYKLRKRQQRVSVKYGENLTTAMPLLDRVADKLRLPSNMKEQAALFYRKALKHGIVRGRSIRAVLAASVYAACRSGGLQRQFREVASVSQVSKKDLWNCYKLLLQEVDVTIPVSDPATWVSKISNLLQLSGRTTNRATSIIEEARQKGITSGKRPHVIAAAAVYLASILENEPLTQQIITEKINITETPLRNRCKELRRTLSISIQDAGVPQLLKYQRGRRCPFKETFPTRVDDIHS
jgi:transcription initiation factor TFIIB